MDFMMKVRWVPDGYKTPDPVGSTFAGVVSKESVQIAFTFAALNGLDILAAEECIPIGSLISEGLHCLWSRVWD